MALTQLSFQRKDSHSKSGKQAKVMGKHRARHHNRSQLRRAGSSNANKHSGIALARAHSSDIPALGKQTNVILPSDSSSTFRRMVLDIQHSYESFWDHIRFKRGWAVPPFSRQESLPLLHRSATIAAAVRMHLDKINPGFKIRLTDGIAREFFWTIQYDPWSQPEEFVQRTVHSTFQDGRGYTDGLTKDVLEDMLEQLEQQLPPLSSLQKPDVQDVQVPALASQQAAQESEGSAAVASPTVVSHGPIKCGQLAERLIQNTKQIGELLEQSKGRLSGCTDGSVIFLLQEAIDSSSKILKVLSQASADAIETRQSSEVDSSEKSHEEGVKQPEEPIQTVSEEEKPESMEPDEASHESEQNHNADSNDLPVQEEKDSTGEQSSEEEDSCMMTIHKVSEQVDDLQTDVEGIHSQVDVLSASDHSSINIDELDSVQRKCERGAGVLLQALLELDSAISSSNGPNREKDREARRAEVRRIEGLIDDCEGMNKKLSALRKELKQDAEQRKARQAAELEAAKKAEHQRLSEEEARQREQRAQEEKILEEALQAAAKNSANKNTRDTEEGKLQDRVIARVRSAFSTVQVHPRQEQMDAEDSIVVQYFLPGWKQSDMDIAVHGNQIVLRGKRLPDADQVGELVERASQRLQQRQLFGLFGSQGRLQPTLRDIIAEGADEFGVFEDALRIPQGADSDDTRARFDERTGVLFVVVPKPRFVYRRPSFASNRQFGRQGHHPHGRYSLGDSMLHNHDGPFGGFW